MRELRPEAAKLRAAGGGEGTVVRGLHERGGGEIEVHRWIEPCAGGRLTAEEAEGDRGSA